MSAPPVGRTCASCTHAAPVRPSVDMLLYHAHITAHLSDDDDDDYDDLSEQQTTTAVETAAGIGSGGGGRASAAVSMQRRSSSVTASPIGQLPVLHRHCAYCVVEHSNSGKKKFRFDSIRFGNLINICRLFTDIQIVS